MKKLTIISCALLLGFTTAFAEKSTWEVPADKAEKLSEVAFSDEMRATGKELFDANCASCHGQPTQGNFVPLAPVTPGDPAGEKFSMNLDGELLYKIQEGRGAMPSFKAGLSTAQIWDVIAYIRSFHKDYVQEVAEEIIRSGLSGGKVAIQLAFNEEKHRVEAVVTEVKPDEVKPITGAPVKILAKRKFGELTLGETKETDNDGKVWFEQPSDLPGDSLGNVELTVVLADEDAFGVAKETAILKVGIPTDKPSLRAKRAMWNTVQKAPIWILLTYSLGVLAVWSVIFFIAFQIRKIFILGKESETEQNL